MQLAFTQLGLLKLAAIDTAVGVNSVTLSGTLLKLINSSSVSLNANTLWGSCSASIGGFDGYSDGTVTFNSPSIADAGTVEAVSTTTVWRPTDSSFSVAGWGIVLTDLGSTSVYAAGPFDDPPLPLGTPFQQAQVTVRFNPAQPALSIVQVLS